jgi:hypothetical protein
MANRKPSKTAIGWDKLVYYAWRHCGLSIGRQVLRAGNVIQ